jgi:YHS domain-containing protein
MIWLLRLLALAVVWFLIGRLWRWLRGRETKSARSVPPTHRGSFKRDPVCGAHVDASLALEAVEDGERFYFCSPQCRETFHIRPRTLAGTGK